MNTKVVYCSTTGNTKKVAESIARAIGCTAETADACTIHGIVDVLFIGGALYATYNHDVNPALKTFVDRLMPGQIKKAVVFGTYSFNNALIQTMKSMLLRKGIPVAEDYYACKGKFMIFKRSHPNAEELAKAGEFARRIVSG